MLSTSISTMLQSREIGSNTLPRLPGTYNTSLSSVIPSHSIIKPHSAAPYKSSSEIVWLGGRENILVSLNSYGQVAYYNLLGNCQSFLINEPSENAYKVFFAQDALFLVSKSKNSDFAQFSKVSLESLQNSCVERVQVLKECAVNSKSIQEIDGKTGKIIIRTSNSIQVWDIFSDRLVASFPYSESIAYSLSENFFVFWEQSKTSINLGIFDLTKSVLSPITISSTHTVRICQMLGMSLLLGLENCHLQIIDLRTGSSKIIPCGLPKIFYVFEHSEKCLAVFANNSFMVFDSDSQELGETTLAGHSVAYTDFRENVVICERGGRLIVKGSRGETVVETGIKNVDQVGVNPDTNQVFLAVRGAIYVVE